MRITIEQKLAAKVAALATLADFSTTQDFVTCLLTDLVTRSTKTMVTLRSEIPAPRQYTLLTTNPERIISGIKAIRTLTGLGLREAKEVSDRLKVGEPQKIFIQSSISLNDVPRILAEGYLTAVTG